MIGVGKLTGIILTTLTFGVSSFGISSMSMKSTSGFATAGAVTSRRDWFQKTSSIVLVGVASSSALFPSPAAVAEVTDETPRITTRMGGQLERYQDSGRGFSLVAPSGWNKFEGEVGAYDVKWQDLVDPRENVKISSTPVKSTTTSVSILGDVKEVGESLAGKRNAKLISAEDRLTDGVLFYKFDFAIKDGTHQLLQLCVSKGKIWSLDANTTEKRWAKREEMYNNILGSFLPKLA